MSIHNRTVDLLKLSDANARLQVQLARHGGSADVIPVRVIGRELLVGAGLHDIGPVRQLDLQTEAITASE